MKGSSKQAADGFLAGLDFSETGIRAPDRRARSVITTPTTYPGSFMSFTWLKPDEHLTDIKMQASFDRIMLSLPERFASASGSNIAYSNSLYGISGKPSAVLRMLGARYVK